MRTGRFSTALGLLFSLVLCIVSPQAEPSRVTGLSSNIEERITDAYVVVKVSWSYEGRCTPSHYIVVYKSVTGHEIYEKVTNRYVVFHWPEVCYPVEVFIQPEASGTRGEPLNQTISLDGVPETPTKVMVRPPNKGGRAWLVSWEDPSKCKGYPGHRYIVNVVDIQNEATSHIPVSTPSITLDRLNECSETWVGIFTINFAGDSPVSPLVKIINPPAPTAPNDVRFNVDRRSRVIHITWKDTSVCPTTNYTLSDLQMGGLVTTVNREANLNFGTPCHRYQIHVKGANPQGLGPASDVIRFFTPRNFDAPTNVRVGVQPSMPNVEVSWLALGDCSSIQYMVTLYVTGVVVKTEVTESFNVVLRNVEKCKPSSVSVKKYTEWWSGDESERKEFQIADLPSAPKLIVVTGERNAPRATVSWAYDGACATTDFLVTVYATTGPVPEPVRASGLRTPITGLPMCVDLQFGVVGLNQVGSGPETKSSSFRIDAVPVAPSATRVKLRPNENSATVSWEYIDTCAAESFQVSLYDSNGLPLRTVNTNGREVHLGDLPVNVPILVDVFGRNAEGTGPRGERVQFILPTKPRTPINIAVSVLPGRTEVNVSWTVANSQTNQRFTVRLYNGSSVIQQRTTEYFNTSFQQVDPCSSWTVGVIAHNAYGTGEEWFTEEFRIPADMPPEPPSGVTVQQHGCKRMVTVSWTHHCAHNYTVFFYSEEDVIKMEDTGKQYLTFGNLPRNKSFHVGIVARNDYWTSVEAPSAEFHTPVDCSSYDHCHFRHSDFMIKCRRVRALPNKEKETSCPDVDE